MMDGIDRGIKPKWHPNGWTLIMRGNSLFIPRLGINGRG
jgi:hypothetical protein